MRTSDYIIITLISTAILVPILIAYFRDFKSNPKEFESALKSITNGATKFLIVMILGFGINKVYESLIPFNKNHGTEYNGERAKIGLPKIGKDWTNDETQSGQFETFWWKPNPNEGHFKKVIEYGIFGLRSEIDYYKNENLKETFAWSKYDFESNKFEYFFEKPNYEMFSVTKNGNLKMEKSTVTIKINKNVFDQYIAK